MHVVFGPVVSPALEYVPAPQLVQVPGVVPVSQYFPAIQPVQSPDTVMLINCNNSITINNSCIIDILIMIMIIYYFINTLSLSL